MKDIAVLNFRSIMLQRENQYNVRFCGLSIGIQYMFKRLYDTPTTLVKSKVVY